MTVVRPTVRVIAVSRRRPEGSQTRSSAPAVACVPLTMKGVPASGFAAPATSVGHGARGRNQARMGVTRRERRAGERREGGAEDAKNEWRGKASWRHLRSEVGFSRGRSRRTARAAPRCARAL